MNVNNNYYQEILNSYPEYVTKEQFYRIAHISKRTAQYLLQSKKIPCIESSKKTRKYKIRTSDIVAYLIDRELRPVYYSSKCSEKSSFTIVSPKRSLYCKMCSLSEKELLQFRNYLAKEFAEMEDVLTVREISYDLGFSCETISRRCTKNEIFSFHINGKRLIPKIALIEYLSSYKGFQLIGKSINYDFILLNFFS